MIQSAATTNHKEHIMSAVTFDTHQFVKTLVNKGFKTEQAEGISEALKDAMTVAEIATRHDIESLELKFRAEIAPLKWASYFSAAGIFALIAKSFL
jgi:hypothetical protein